jgi:hypothetical protein
VLPSIFLHQEASELDDGSLRRDEASFLNLCLMRFFAALEQPMLGVREKAQKAHKG